MINLTDDTIKFPPSIMNDRIKELAVRVGGYDAAADSRAQDIHDDIKYHLGVEL